ncbi:hypothetical protein HYALB_00002024 [Hymenoscyphus albidus]|uniref:WD40 repeat-like protein n=1 Tax=Hymenoscyphus albidus TaxID=595503 RepID=A0A9N9LF60_9HELO|nr:hypothetical protein HYALB_00002024 [Hymenoscyphus albidus]
MSIKHVHTLNPVTALEFYTAGVEIRLLLAAEGSFLKVFNAENSELISQCEVFHEQTIHGIAVNRGSQESGLELVIWGGNSLILLSRLDFEQILHASVTSTAGRAVKVSDWILDVAIWESCCVLVTAHNALLRASFDKNHRPVIEDLPSPSESILYSAHVVWDTPEQILVAAGTVFGEIIYWRGSVAENGSFGDVQTLFTFTGHEGSIFGVNISPIIVGHGNEQTRLLASCSDDRAIRIWDLAEDAEKKGVGEKSTLRETGFGENERDAGTNFPDERCLAMVMGHASRIWGVKFLVGNSKDLGFPLVNVLSLGEDSTAQQWSLELAEQVDSDVEMGGVEPVLNSGMKHTAKLIHVDTYAFNSGKHIWSSGLVPEGNGIFHIATGGADGKISKYDIKLARKGFSATDAYTQDSEATNEPSDSDVSLSAWDLEEVLNRFSLHGSDNMTTLQPARAEVISDPEPILDSISDENPPKRKKKAKKVHKDAFNRYAFVTTSTFITTTTFGRVLTGQLGVSTIWNEIFLPQSGKDDLRSYSIVEGFPELSTAFLAGDNGNIYSYQPGNLIGQIGKVDGKVADMFKIHDIQANTYCLLVTTLSTKVATLFSVKPMADHTIQYTLPDEFVVTAGGMYNGMLILGSRKGSLAVYHPQNPEQPVCTWNDQRFSSGDSFTTILVLPPPTDIPEKIYILTTGRNGVYSIFSLGFYSSNEGLSGEIHPVHCGTPSFGPMIEAAWFEDGDLILYGFKSKNFVAWNETKQYEITSVDCGGAHRSYAYSALSNSAGAGHFVYTKASKLYIHSQSKPSHEIIKPGGHGREIKTTAISGDKRFIATGAEDTAIRIWQYTEDSNAELSPHFNNLAVVQSHTAGIQHLQWHNSTYLLSSGGNEEFFIWSISTIPSFGIGVICEASCPDPSADQDLRIMSFDVTSCPIHLSPDGQESLLLSLAYSDSTIRCYIYNKFTGYILIGTGNYTSSCLTQITHLDIKNDTVCLLTASTDGRVPIWNLPLIHQFIGEDLDMENSFHPSPPRLEMISTSKIHQNAIKSLDVQTHGGYIFVVTGGDDNALAISIYQSSNMGAKPQIFILRKAHAAAITGISILPSSFSSDSLDIGEGAFRVVSASNDQRVKEWEVSVAVREGDGGLEVRIRNSGDVFTSVADVGDLAVLGGGGGRGDDSVGVGERVLVVGNGMEVWGVGGVF